LAAVEWFNNKDFHGNTIGVFMAESKNKETDEPKGDATVTYEDPHAALAAVEWFNNKDFHGNTIGVFMAESKNKNAGDAVEFVEFDGGAEETNGGAGRGRGQADSSAKPWQQDGDWMCPNTRSVM
jgi:RNA recognition motif-containing protein